MPKDLTIKEAASRGGRATDKNHTKEEKSAWGKKGVQALKDKYGEDYFSRMAKERQLHKQSLKAREQKKRKAKSLINALFRK